MRLGKLLCLAVSIGLGLGVLDASAQSAGDSSGTSPVSTGTTATASTPSPYIVSTGTSVLDAALLGSSAALQVAPGATAIIDFSSTSTLTFTGDILNNGSIFAISSNPAFTSANFSAQNIFNNQGAMFSSILPASLSSFASGLPNLSLSLNAVNQIVNAGTISSAANLSMTAANIVNTNIMSAVQNVNLVSQLGNIVNSGVIAAQAGNVNLSTIAAQNLLVNNVNGVMQALLGNVNLSTASTNATLEKLNINFTGGNILAQELNLNAINGLVDVNANIIEGVVNVNSCGAHITASTPNLSLGQMNIVGDPTFYNTGGSINIANNLNFAPVNFVSGPVSLAIVAQGDITASNGVNLITISSQTTGAPNNWPGTPYAGSILMVAGAAFTATPDNSPVSTTGSPPAGDTGSPLVITGASAGGGSINLAGVTVNAQAGQTGVSSASGNVTLIAYGVAGNSNGNINVGPILTGETSVQSNDVSGVNGNVTIIGTGNITVNSINTSGNFLNPVLYSGNILIASATPEILEMPVPNNLFNNTATFTTLVSPAIYGGVTNTAANPGNTVLTLNNTAGISAGQQLVIDPQGPNYELVTVVSVSGSTITVAAPIAKFHANTETVYVRPTQAGASITVNPGAGVLPGVPPGPATPVIFNNAIFAPGMSSLSNGIITVGGANVGTGAITIVTNGSVVTSPNSSISLSLNPTTATPLPLNYLRLPTINITAPSVTVGTGSTINSSVGASCLLCANSTYISTNTLVNNGVIGSSSGSNQFVNVSSTGNLTVSGTGSFSSPVASVIELAAADQNSLTLNSNLAFNTGVDSLVILNAQRGTGTINVNGTMNFTGSPVVSVNSSGLNLNSGGFSSDGGGSAGAFLFGSGYTADPLNVTINGTFSLAGSPSAFTAHRGQNLSLLGSGTLSSSAPVLFQTKGAGVYANAGPVSLSGNNFYTTSNPSGDIQGVAFQPYVGGRISSTNSTIVQFAAYPYHVALNLIGNLLATTDTTSVPGQTLVSPQFDFVSTYTQVSSTIYTAQAAQQLGIGVSAGVFADINGDGTMTQSAFNTAVYDIATAASNAGLYGNTIDIVVGNEDIVAATGSKDASASMATLQTLIQGGNVNIQFVGSQAVTGAQPTRNATVNPLTGANFTPATLPVVTRQQNGVLNLVTDPLPANSAGMTALMNSLDGYVYGNYYPFFDQSTVVPTLISTPNITQAAFGTLVTNYMTSQFTTNTTNFTTAGITGTTIRVGETGWATPMVQLSSNALTGYAGVGLPQQNLTWAGWYFGAMQTWSNTQTDPLNGNAAGIVIATYFDGYNEPWKGVVGKVPNGVPVTVGAAGASPGATVLPVSTSTPFYSPTLTPMSIVINPGGATQEVQNYYLPDPANGTLPLSSTNFPGAIVNTHAAGENIVAGSPQEPFFGLFVANGTNLSTGSLYDVTSISQQFSITPLGLTQLPSTPSVSATPLSTAPAPTSFLSNAFTPPLFSTSFATQVTGSTIIPTDVNPEIIPGADSDTGDLSARSATPSNPSLAGAFNTFNNNVLPNPDGPLYTLASGSGFFLPDHDLTVETPSGKVSIAQGAAVMIFQNESGMSVFNLYDNQIGDVAVSIGDQSQELGVGRQITVTNKRDSSLSDVLPNSVAVRNVNSEKVGPRNVISSEFSHSSAFSNFAGLKKLFKSDDKDSRKHAERILKTAAALTLINKGQEAYQPQK